MSTTTSASTSKSTSSIVGGATTATTVGMTASSSQQVIITTQTASHSLTVTSAFTASSTVATTLTDIQQLTTEPASRKGSAATSIIIAVVVSIILVALVVIVILVYRRARRSHATATHSGGIEPFTVERPKLGWDERALALTTVSTNTNEHSEASIALPVYTAPLEGKKATPAWGPGYEIRDKSKASSDWGLGYDINAKPQRSSPASKAPAYDVIEASSSSGPDLSKPQPYEKPQLRSWGVNYDYGQSRVPVHNTAYEPVPESTL